MASVVTAKKHFPDKGFIRDPQMSLFLDDEYQRNINDSKKHLNSFSTRTKRIGAIPYVEGEFWTPKQRQGHRLHEISYRACFKPQLPKFFIERYTKTGDIVFDPFMGRGTTLVEAGLLGRIPYGNDVSPLSKALVEPRIDTPTLTEVSKRLARIDWDSFKEYKNKDLLAFYHPKTLAQLEGLKDYLINQELDRVDLWIRMVAVNRLSGHSPGFFSIYTLPPNQAMTISRQEALNQKYKRTPPMRSLPELIFKKSKILLAQGGLSVKKYLLMTRSSKDIPDINNGEVSLTVTSPPFLDVVDYKKDNWLRNWFIGAEDFKGLSIYRKIEDWENFVKDTLRELSRITKVGGHIAFEVGEVRKDTVRLEENVVNVAKRLPLKLQYVLINTQNFTKTSNCWGVSNNKRGTNSNRVVVFKRI